MKIKTSELTGMALNYAVAIAIGYQPDITQIKPGSNQKWVGPIKIDNAISPFIGVCIGHRVGRSKRPYISCRYEPSTLWQQGGDLIEQFDIEVGRVQNSQILTGNFYASIVANGMAYFELGQTPLIAICRAVVVTKVGDEVEVPDELLLGGAE